MRTKIDRKIIFFWSTELTHEKTILHHLYWAADIKDHQTIDICKYGWPLIFSQIEWPLLFAQIEFLLLLAQIKRPLIFAQIGWPHLYLHNSDDHKDIFFCDICTNRMTTGSFNFLRPCPWKELILGVGSAEANRQPYLFQIIFPTKKWKGNFRLTSVWDQLYLLRVNGQF